MKKIVRNHDIIVYEKENRYENPKHLHLKIIELIKNNMSSKKGKIISDYWSAAGELQYTLMKEFSNHHIIGYEYLDKLLIKAKENVRGVQFLKGDITNKKTSKKNSNDFSLSIGVLQIFDSFEKNLSNLIYWTKPGGFIFAHALFNDFDLDVYIKYNHSDDYNEDFRESGWNIFSKNSISTFLNNHDDVLSYEFIDFKIDFEVPKQNDSLRSWTIDDSKGEKLITNGLSLIQPHSILKIQIK